MVVILVWNVLGLLAQADKNISIVDIYLYDMSVVQETWNWIERQEIQFVSKGVPFSDRQVNYLVAQLRLCQPYVHKHCKDQELVDQFADKMESKFYNMEYHDRYLLFDFVKNFIHENLIKKSLTWELGQVSSSSRSLSLQL